MNRVRGEGASLMETYRDCQALIVDDEPSICWALDKLLSGLGMSVQTCSSIEEAWQRIGDDEASSIALDPDLVLLDVRLPGEDGISALPRFADRFAGVPVIVMTAFGDLETAVSAIQAGAADYITKPFSLDEVQQVCSNAIEAKLAREVAEARADTQVRSGPSQLGDTHTGDGSDSSRAHYSGGQLVGMSAAMQVVFKQIALVADSELAVLITGETGTGKELVAAAIHRHSSRRDKAYLPLAPVALSPDLIESELFGHVAGAFTGATSDRQGLFEKANGGTILLDEIGDLPLRAQLKLLRVLDSGQYLRVGDVEPRTCDVRVLAATNRDLQAGVREGTFREDLYYRLNGLRIALPPLRAREGDIELLARYFLQRGGRSDNLDRNPSLVETLRQRSWLGNVRELRNAIEHAAVLARGRPITAADLPEEQKSLESVGSTGEQTRLRDAIHAWCQEKLESGTDPTKGLQQAFYDETQLELIAYAMKATNGNRSKAAELLGIHRGTLREKLRDASETRPNDNGEAVDKSLRGESRLD